MITKDMNIGEILQNNEKAAEIMMGYGLHCIGCHISLHESLQDGCSAHGLDDETIDKMVAEINAAS